jgi:hypothetical protein
MASAQEHGMIRITKFNQATKVRTPLKEQRSEILGYVAPASRTNPQEQDERVAFLEGGYAIDEKELVEVQFVADAADTIESEESKLHIDVTIVDKKTKRELPSSLNFENMTGFKAGGTVDIACREAEDTRVAYYEVPAGQQIVLGRKDGRGKIYCYLGDDTA